MSIDNHPSLEEVAIADRGAFQQHYLRAYAPVFPWYARPELEKTPYTLDEFLQIFHRQMLHVLRPPSRIGGKSQEHTLQRRLHRHLSYAALSRILYFHTGEMSIEQLTQDLRHEYRRIAQFKELRLSTPHHPLFTDYRSYAVPDRNPRLIDASGQDTEFASWMDSQDIPAFIAAIPEFTQPDAKSHVLHTAVQTRALLREKLKGKTFIPQDVRDEGINLLMDEWVAMVDAQPEHEESVEALISELQLGAMRDDPDAMLAALPPPVSCLTVEDEARLAPLYEQVLARIVCEKWSDEAVDFVNAWAETRRRLNLPPCDRPSLPLAIMAMHLRDEDTDAPRVMSLL